MKALDVAFPLFAFEKDDRSMYLIESPERFLYHLEAIDIENGKHLFWDSNGAGVCVSVTRGVIEQVAYGDQAMTLPQTFHAYAQAFKLRMSGQSPLDIWRSLQSQLPPRKTLWSRLLGSD